MKPASYRLWTVGCLAVLFLLSPCHPVLLSAARGSEDEHFLQRAELSGDGPALVGFFQARARTEVDAERLRQLMQQFAADGQASQAATAELLGLGALALQAMRRTANDLEHPDVAARAARCLPWLEGPSSRQLLIAAAHVLAERKPAGAAAALLAYLPFADRPEVVNAVNDALAALAAKTGKVDADLERGLSDRMGMRRAAAVVALCKAVPPEKVPTIRKLLRDPVAAVRVRAALALAEANDAEAIPVLIDLLAELNAEQRKPVEERLTALAGEWAPNIQFAADDAINRQVRRDAWASWWRRRDGAMLLAAVAQHTLTPDKRREIQELLVRLGSDDFKIREDASRKLLAFGRLALPQLREASKNRDAEIARRATLLLEDIDKGPDRRLPIAALRLLAVRKPAGAVEALLAYLPHAEDGGREEEVRKTLTVLAMKDGKPEPALRRALVDTQTNVRALAAEVLIQSGGAEGHAAVAKLLAEDVPSVRLRAALALARSGEREGVAVLIELLPQLSDELFSQCEEALYQLAGDASPKMPEGAAAADKKKHREAWAAWWKVNASRIPLNRLGLSSSLLGYTLICDFSGVLEVDRNGKTRWSISDTGMPSDAIMLSDDRVLIAECGTRRITVRDRKGTVLWEKANLPSQPTNVQRLPNGNTFLAVHNGPIMEVNATGKEIYQINNVAGVLAAYRSRKGEIVCLTGGNQCLLLDTTGKTLRSFNVKHPINQIGCLDVLPDGRILIASLQGNKVMEYDSQGKLLRELDAPGVTTPTGLPNGHILVSSENGMHAVELDRAGKIVWERKGVKAYRARRR